MDLSTAGTPPAFDHTRGPKILICNWLWAGAAVLVVTLRLWTKCVIKKQAWWDDATVPISLLIAIVYSAGVTVQVRHGYGQHKYYLTSHDVAVLGTGKPTAWFQNSPVWAALFLNSIVVILSLLIFTTLCFPLKGLWDKGVDSTCVNLTMFNDIWRVLISINCLVDFMLAIVPCIRVYHLQLRGKLRLSVNLLLSCGLVTACMSIGKARYQLFNTSKDPSRDLVISSYFVALEMYLAIIFSGIPAISQLYFHIRERGSPFRSSRRSLLPLFMWKNSNQSGTTALRQTTSTRNLLGSRDNGFAPHGQDEPTLLPVTAGEDEKRKGCVNISIHMVPLPECGDL